MIFPFIFQLHPYEQQRPCRLPYLGLCDCCYSVLWQSTNYHLCSIMLCWWNTFCTLRKCYTKKIGDDCKNKHWRTNSTLSSRWWWRKNLILNSLDISWFFFLQILPHPYFPSTSLWCFLFAGIRCAFVSLRITVISFISSLCRIVVVLVRFPFQEFAYRSSFSRGFLSRTLLSFCVCDTNIPIYLYTDPVWKEVRW